VVPRREPDERDQVTEQEAAEPAPQPSKKEQLQARVGAISTKSATLVFRGPQGAVALLEGRLVREGDQLSPGVRIVAIEPSGVVVEVTPDDHLP
jgi:hypothetical protein